jgi:hypothetical protein
MDKMSSSLFNGFIGGLFGSFLVVLLGITIETYVPNSQGAFASGITYIWIIAILMAMIHVRYLCFSYAGGLVALVSLIFGFPNVYVPGLMALVGILHLIESLFICKKEQWKDRWRLHHEQDVAYSSCTDGIGIPFDDGHQQYFRRSNACMVAFTNAAASF